MKTFTIDEAERILPDVKKFSKKAQKFREKLVWLLEANDAWVEVNDDFGFHYFVTENVKVNKEFHRLYYQFYSAIESLAGLGVVISDVDEGVIDFPFKIKNKDAFLCWTLGDDKLRYWHSCSCDASERKKILDIDDLL